MQKPMAEGSTLSCLRRVPFPRVARKGAPPAAESSDRSGWAGTWFCANEVQGKTLVPTRRKEPKDAFFTSGLPSVGAGEGAVTRKMLRRPWFVPDSVHQPAAMTCAHPPAVAPPGVHHPSLRWWSEVFRAAYMPPLQNAFWRADFNHFPKENTFIVHCTLSIVH